MLSTVRKRGKEMLERGMKQWATEAVGDCWLISLLAGSEGLDAEQVRSFTDDQRNTFLTPWRKTLVEVAPHVDTKCLQCEPGHWLEVRSSCRRRTRLLIVTGTARQWSIRFRGFTDPPAKESYGLAWSSRCTYARAAGTPGWPLPNDPKEENPAHTHKLTAPKEWDPKLNDVAC